MKLIKQVSGAMVALALAAFSAQAAEQAIAKVVNIKGAARYMTADQTTWRPLKTGAVLKEGTVIQTASGSHVDLVLRNSDATFSQAAGLDAAEGASASTDISTVAHSEPNREQDAVRVYENTVLGLDKLAITQTGADKVTETQLDLKAGRILGTVKKLSAASDYKIKIPNGVAGVRGTIYVIDSSGVLSVLSGSVILAYVNADGTTITQEVRAGQQYDPKTGQMTNIPEAQLRVWIKDARALGIGPNTPPTTFTVDRTVYFVSPTTGQNGLGGGPDPE